MMKINFRRLFVWAALLGPAMIVFLFLHECGHGIGARLDGERVSTGFNRVGDYGKKPADPDFRSESLISGRVRWSGLLGPLTNWFFGMVLAGMLLARKRAGRGAMMLGAGAAANGFMRLVPMTVFFVGAALGRFSLEDEAGWGLASVETLDFPMSAAEFKVVSLSRPEALLAAPEVFAWPAFSLALSLFILMLTYGRLLKLYRPDLPSVTSRLIFVLMPLAVWPFVFFLAAKLDNLVRINW